MEKANFSNLIAPHNRKYEEENDTVNFLIRMLCSTIIMLCIFIVSIAISIYYDIQLYIASSILAGLSLLGIFYLIYALRKHVLLRRKQKHILDELNMWNGKFITIVQKELIEDMSSNDLQIIVIPRHHVSV